jgi:DNA-directed RNA polymerase subunit RPC12/RpoP
MKFLCLDCDEPMKLHGTQGPDEGSLTVTFRCPECGFRVAMLTNPFETQMVKSLGVKVGNAPAAAPEPFQHLRGAMAGAHVETLDASDAGAEVGTGTPAGGGCPFAAMLNETTPVPTEVTWTSEAEARMDRVPSFIRPMARKAIERFAEAKGYPAVTETVMDEARGALGM